MSEGLSPAATSADTSAATAAEAKQSLARCEQEIATIKTALRNLGQPSDTEDQNTLIFNWIKVEGLPEAAAPHLTLQLSSPIETAHLSKVYTNVDPVATQSDTVAENVNDTENLTDNKDGETAVSDEEMKAADKKIDSDEGIVAGAAATNKDGSYATFRGVETGQATLSVEAMDADIPLGSSTAYDLAPYTSRLLDAMNPITETYTAEIQVPILPPYSSSDDESICTITLKVLYTPSSKDKREELYELLNKANEKKAVAIEKLRQSAMAAARARATDTSTTSQQVPAAKPAVKPGFLNKKEKEKETVPTGLIAWYNKYLGPDSLVRMYFPVARNYILFAGFLAFSHFKGEVLSLPQPV